MLLRRTTVDRHLISYVEDATLQPTAKVSTLSFNFNEPSRSRHISDGLYCKTGI